MNIIDEQGLTDSPVPVRIYAKALNIEGFVLAAEDRDLVMHSFRLHPPEAGKITVYTGTGAADYWAGAPTTVRVLIMPMEMELSALLRSPAPLEWELRKLGVPHSAARGLAVKAPTPKHAMYGTFVRATQNVGAWELLRDLEGQLPEMGYLGDYEPPSDDVPYDVTIVTKASDFKHLADHLRKAVENDEIIGMDVETDEEENFEAKLVGIGFAFGASSATVGEWQGDGPRPRPQAYYLPLNGPLDVETVLGLLQLYLSEREPPRWVGHNGKYDAQALARDLRPDGPLKVLRALLARLAGDGLIAAYCLAEVDYHTGRPKARDLKTQAEELFGVRMLHFQEMLNLSGAKRSSEAPLTDIGPYCCADAFWGVKVEEKRHQQLRRYPKLLNIYEKVELPTVKITADMEFLGIPLDYDLLSKRRQEYYRRVEVYRRYLEQQACAAGYVLTEKKKMCKLHGKKKVEYAACEHCDERGRVDVVVPFNPNSGPQVEAVLQGVFGLPRMASTDGGAASNDEASLLRLREFTSNEDARDWITMKLAWSKDNKVLGAYLGNPEKGIEVGERDEKGMWDRKRRHVDYNLPPGVVADESWFIHPTWNQAVTTSSRYSSKNPNGQNIPFNMRDLFTVKGLAGAVKR